VSGQADGIQGGITLLLNPHPLKKMVFKKTARLLAILFKGSYELL
jgi:hypothetical protein